MEEIIWTTKKLKLGDLVEWNRNPVKITKAEAKQLNASLDKFGLVLPFVANQPLADGKADLIDGHQRKKVHYAHEQGNSDTLVDVRIPSRALTEKEREELVIRLRKNSGSFDDDLLKAFDPGDLQAWGFDDDELKSIGFETATNADAEPQIDRAAELQEKWQVALGDIWQIGDHRLICGDCTDEETIRGLLASLDRPTDRYGWCLLTRLGMLPSGKIQIHAIDSAQVLKTMTWMMTLFLSFSKALQPSPRSTFREIYIVF